MNRKTKLKLLGRELKKPQANYYGAAVERRLVDLNAVGSAPTVLSEFAAGYVAALENVRHHGFDKVSANAFFGTII